MAKTATPENSKFVLLKVAYEEKELKFVKFKLLIIIVKFLHIMVDIIVSKNILYLQEVSIFGTLSRTP